MSSYEESFLAKRMKIDSNTVETPNSRKRIIQVIDWIDSQVENVRKEALRLQEARDDLLMTVDLLKNNEFLAELGEADREEIGYYIKRVNDRLKTIDLNVQTVRDQEQEISLHRINTLIDEVITLNCPISKRKRFQEYLNACSSSEIHLSASTSSSETILIIDKKFENTLLGCTLDDQKRIKKRLEALLVYMGQKIVSE